MQSTTITLTNKMYLKWKHLYFDEHNIDAACLELPEYIHITRSLMPAAAGLMLMEEDHTVHTYSNDLREYWVVHILKYHVARLKYGI